MQKRNFRNGSAFSRKPCVIATEIAIAMMTAQFAYAQQPASGMVDRVEITGTRLPQLSTEGVSPITVLNAKDIKMDGLGKTEDLLNNMPQVFATQGSTVANGASGTANVSLRGLGVNRNLVLVNGRRMTAGSPANGAGSYAADLNQIPAPLIQRVELLTGGGSAVYGSDAISGVVNFIMNDKFEGVQIDYNFSSYMHEQQNPAGIADIIRARAVTNPAQFFLPGDVSSDGDVSNVSVMLGRNFADNKGNATVFFNYKKEDPILQEQRDFSSCALNPGAVFTCGGSSTSFPGRFALGDFSASRTVTDAAGNIRAFANATDQYNFGPTNFYRRPAEHYGFNAFAHYDINRMVRAYSEFSFHDNHTVAQIAPGGIFLGSSTFTLNFENPLISAPMKAFYGLLAPGNTAQALIGRRNVEGGGRQDDLRHTSYRWVLGAKGTVSKGMDYDIFAQTGKVLHTNIARNRFSISREARALDVITNPATGLPACRTFVAGTDLNCVPYNIWSLGQVTQAALNYLQIPGLSSGSTEQRVMGGTLSMDLGTYGWKLPAAKNGLGVVMGVERRQEALSYTTDLALQIPDLDGQGGPTLGQQGRLRVDEVFGEVRVPLIEGRPMADLLSMNGSYRWSQYSTNQKTDTYGAGVEWAPVKNYRFRGSYQRAVRHANIIELFQPTGNNLTDMTDPCGAAAQAAGGAVATAAQCARSGTTAATFGSAALDSPAGQYNILTGGNPALTPEKADSHTLGMVFTPTRNLTGTIDWWRIKVDEAVGTSPGQTTLNQCVFNNVGCANVRRDVNGTLWLLNTGLVVATNQNLATFNTSGLDMAVNYGFGMGRFGRMNLNAVGTLVTKWEYEPIKGLGKVDCKGLYGSICGTPTPKWRHKVRASWTTPINLEVAATWRHIDSATLETASGQALVAAAATAATDLRLGARDYLDLAASYQINKTFSVRAGMNNVFDTDPPIVSSVVAGPSIFGNGNTFPQIYDTLGRLVFVNVTAKF